MYTDSSLESKLGKLADTQDSINLLSHWLIFHRKNAPEAVQVWAAEFSKVSTSRKLAFLHLANDVLQVSRKKADDYAKEYAKVLPNSLKLFSAQAPPELNAKVRRLLTIWDERGVYAREFVAELKRHVGGGGGSESAKKKEQRPSSSSSASGGSRNPPASPTKSSSSSAHNQSLHPQHHHHNDTVKTILHHTDTIKHLHTNRMHLEKTISTAEPSLDPAIITSQVNALTMALTSELSERKKLIEDLKKWISTEESACSKIVDAMQDLTANNPIASINKDFHQTAVLQPPPPPTNTSVSSFQAHAPPAAATKEMDFEAHTPSVSPLSPPSVDVNAMDIMTLPPPPPPPPLPADPNMIPPELLFAAQSALQNNDGGSNDVMNLLNGLTGSGNGGSGGLFGFGGDSGGLF
ncbi:RNA polymerase II-binding domain-containing protein [Obelidium mucronatum]|nr:RNA polymerase II-binding domain-containing protein [Obelidium mucronatum]